MFCTYFTLFFLFSYHYFHHFHSILLSRDTINFTIFYNVFLFYFYLSSLPSLPSILFFLFENSASLPLSRVCCFLIPVADLTRSFSLVGFFLFVWLLLLLGCVCVFLVAIDFLVVGNGPIFMVLVGSQW